MEPSELHTYTEKVSPKLWLLVFIFKLMELFHLGLFGHHVPRIVVQVPEHVNEYVTYGSQGVLGKIVKPLPNC